MALTLVRAVAIVPAALLLFHPAFGQQVGDPPQPAAPIVQPAPAPAPVVVLPNRTPPPPSSPPPAIPQEHPAPIYVSGRVATDDGSPFADPVVIESVCDGVSHAEGFAGPNGDFGFRLGDSNSGIMQDASVRSANDYFGSPNVQEQQDPSNNAPPRYIVPKELEMADCGIRAVLPGYKSDTIGVGNRRALENPNVGTIMLHRMGKADGQAVSVTSLAAPKDARAAFDKGRQALKKNQPEDAQKEFEKATHAYPAYATAWFELGKLASGRGQFDSALSSFQTAMRADPKYVDSYLSVAAIQSVEKQWAPLLETTAALLRLDPYDYPQAYYMNALANYALKNMDAAEKSASAAEKIDAQCRFPRTWQLLGAILANRRAFPEAAGQLRQYLKAAPEAPDAAAARAELSQLEAASR